MFRGTLKTAFFANLTIKSAAKSSRTFYRQIYLVSLAISAVHKNSISNQMVMVDGRAYRVTQLVTSNKDVYLRFLAARAFICDNGTVQFYLKLED